jgi:hypothetical protein
MGTIGELGPKSIRSAAAGGKRAASGWHYNHNVSGLMPIAAVDRHN